jgi:hypothetical protein
MVMEEGILPSIFALIIFIVPVFIFPPYIPIYFVWSRDTINMESNFSNNRQNISKFSNLTQKRIKGIDRVLHGEKVIAGISGTINKGLLGTNADVTGSVVLTPTRVVFYSKKILGGYHYRDYQISNISNITFSSGLLFNDIILHTNNTDIKVRNIPKKDLSEKFVDNVKSCIASSANYQLIREDDIDSDLSISRETEFYQGFIRFKMSVTNTSLFVVNDVALDFDYDDDLLRIDRHEPDYQIKNGRTIFGNISGNSSKTIAVYFDPMMCSKSTAINCQVNYKDAKGQPQTTHMEPKKISVVCPIMETESDINIGRLKEIIEQLPYRDSKVYQIQNGFDIDLLKNISREIVQKHDVKHIRTLFTKDGNTCEIWYYGKTKVHGHDIVIKITILSDTKSIELFAATETVESLAGLLAEVGRELKSAIESQVTGNVQQIINVSIKDSIIQRSNLLSYCDINGNCSGDVVIEDSLVQRSNISSVESENEGVNEEMDKNKVYNYLVSIVNNRSNVEDMKIGYKDVLNYFNRDTKYLPLLFTRLGEICKSNHERNEPLISAIVVNEKTSMPGKGFFENCLRKYRGYIGPSDGPEAQEIHEEELIRVFNYWHNGDEKTCPACGEVVQDGAKFCMECGEKLQ